MIIYNKIIKILNAELEGQDYLGTHTGIKFSIDVIKESIKEEYMELFNGIKGEISND